MEINICIGSACHIKGSQQVIIGLQQLIKEHQLEKAVELKASFCLGHCTEAVSVQIDEKIFSVSEQSIKSFFIEQVLERLNR